MLIYFKDILFSVSNNTNQTKYSKKTSNVKKKVFDSFSFDGMNKQMQKAVDVKYKTGKKVLE
jgi:hypothetical protein